MSNKSKSLKNQYFPQTVTHPGETLAEKLEEMGMGIKEFALRTGKPEQTVIKVINAESSITPDMAVRFEDVLKIPAHFWMRHQRSFDEALARNKRKDAIESAVEWVKEFPYAKMASFGWVQPTRRVDEKVEALFQYFGVSNHHAWEAYYYGKKLKLNFRISLAHTNKPFALASWLRQGELQANQMQASEYDASAFKSNLKEIKMVMANHPNNFFKELQALCSTAGVKVVHTPCLPGAPIHGSTRWINDTPLIQLSARYKQNDIFWFTFFHEAGHILKHGKKYISLENVDYDEKEVLKEKEADQFAIDWTFSEKEEEEVYAAKPLSENDVISFAEKFGTHPAMIIGRFHHKRLLPFSMGRQFIKPIDLSMETNHN